MTPGIWLSLALAALIGEFLTGTFYLLVFAVAFAAGGLLAFAGATLAVQLVGASAAALLGVLVLLKRRKPRHSPAADDLDLGERVEVVNWQGAYASVRYRGALWQAKAASGEGGDCTHAQIVGRDGNLLLIRPVTKEPKP
ncbi:NfeD family protein [Crenobacter intestini]|uniref:NfeD family protein n=1 Tax=Crenobacter intestini TaxID=2563443 RepID=A0A4T0UWE5_9NEIS|nr:NfeD family protein [Crenobacter intestini]TIC83187.1 NfeD family protein [Crenobacter intestini]